MQLSEITYTDAYIVNGLKAVHSLKNFYDTILTCDIDDKENIIRIPIEDFFLKYRTQLESTILEYSIPTRYYYKPKMLSFDLYGTTEFWLSLLRVNNMKNITEFNEPIIKIYNPDGIKRLIKIFFKREKKIN